MVLKNRIVSTSEVEQKLGLMNAIARVIRKPEALIKRLMLDSSRFKGKFESKTE